MSKLTEDLAFKMFEKYIDAWNNRDTKTLDDMFSMDVFLGDWEVSVQGKESVIGANVQIWENVPDIKIEIRGMAYNEKTEFLYGSLSITSYKESLDLRVVDVIKFYNNKIVKVDAYKQ